MTDRPATTPPPAAGRPADRLHLSPRHRTQLEALLREHLPGVEVWACGSRITGESHDGSDLDLVLRAPGLQKIPIGRLSDLWEALRESTIPFLVEARDWARLPEGFHGEIERDYVVLVEWKQANSARSKDNSQERNPVIGTAVSLGWPELPFTDAIWVNPPVLLKHGEEYPFVDMAAIDVGSRQVYAIQHRKYSGGGSRFRNGDTLMARITPCLENGKIARYSSRDASETAHGSTEFIVIRGRPDVTDTEFSYYLTRWEEVRSYAVGQMTGTSGRQRVPTESLNHLIIPIPPLPEQRAIAYVLGALDDKIELNRRMNETLEAMARALFQSWFVDFDPVRAKMEGRDTGLPKEIADLFPDRLVDSEMGRIPWGWRTDTLDAIASLNPEFWSTRNAPEQVTYVDLANTKRGHIKTVETYSWSTAPNRARRVLRPGDTIIGTVRPGNESYALIGGDGLTASTGFAVLRPRTSNDREIVWCAATSRGNIERLAHLAGGSAYPAVRPSTVAETRIVLSEASVRKGFSSITAGWFDRIENNKRTSRKLAGLRDALLAPLVSGKLRVLQTAA